MTTFGCGLKSCTQTHTKHDIGPRCTKVKIQSLSDIPFDQTMGRPSQDQDDN
jgi:hypothetical protein